MKRSLAALAAACNGRLLGADAAFGQVSTDSRKLAAGDLFVAIAGERHDGHDFAASARARGAAGMLVARPLESDLPQVIVEDTIAALGRGAAAWRAQFSLPLVGVAGSNGKTTTKELLASILRHCGNTLATAGNLNTDIGLPVTLFRLQPEHEFAVIEVGANHPGEVARLVRITRPTVGLVTNAGAEHLEFFGSLDGAARAEGEMLAGLEATGTAVINADDPFASLWREMSQAGRSISFGTSQDAEFRAVGYASAIEKGEWATRFELRTPAGAVRIQLALPGHHNVLNATGAAAAAWACGASLGQIAAGLGEVTPVRGRMRLMPGLNGTVLIDDSYNANPSSAAANLQVLASLPGERWLVLGEMAELGQHAVAGHVEVGQAARSAGVSRLLAIGPTTLHAVEAFGAGGRWFPDVASLVAALGRDMHPRLTVLVKGSRVNHLEDVVAALQTAPPLASNGN